MNASTLAPVSDQCEFESWNATTNCWNLRGCASCLQTPGCKIGSEGVCQSNTINNYGTNFTWAFRNNQTLPAAKDADEATRRKTQAWEFGAFDATYCAASDSVCKECIQAKFWAGPGGMIADSRFCVGSGGCICVMNCEFKDAQPEPVCTAPQAKQNSTVPTVTVTPSYDHCRYVKQFPSQLSYPFRSCSECVTTPGCRIGTDGYCEPDVNPSAELDYHLAFTYNLTLPTARELNATGLQQTQRWQFPAFQATYCPKDSLTYQKCIHEDYWLGRSSRDSRFCVAPSGCIAVANCERDDWANAGPGQSGWERFTESLPIVGFVSFFVCIFLGALYGCHRCNRRREPSARHVQRVQAIDSEQDSTGSPVYVEVRPL